MTTGASGAGRSIFVHVHQQHRRGAVRLVCARHPRSPPPPILFVFSPRSASLSFVRARRRSAGGGGDRGVWFNDHATGSGKTDVFPLCVRETYAFLSASTTACTNAYGRAAQHIKSAAVCQRASEVLGLGWGGTVSSSSRPEYCYKEGTTLYLNANSANVASGSAYPVCTMGFETSVEMTPTPAPTDNYCASHMPDYNACSEGEFLLCTVTFYANLAHSLTRSP